MDLLLVFSCLRWFLPSVIVGGRLSESLEAKKKKKTWNGLQPRVGEEMRCFPGSIHPEQSFPSITVHSGDVSSSEQCC